MKNHHQNSEEKPSQNINQQTVRSLIEIAQKYSVLFDSSLFCLFLLDFEGNILDANDAALNLLGYTREDIPLYNITSLIGDEAPVAFQIMEKIKQDGAQRSPVQFRVKKKDGENVWLEVEGALLSREGTPYAILGIARNVTPHKMAEHILRESENRYRSIFDNTGTAIIIIEDDTTISMINRECENLTGYLKEEVEGKKCWTEFVVKEELERLREYHRLRRTEPARVPRTYETRMINKHGNIKDIVVTTTMIPGTQQRVVSLLDITEQRAAEKALEESEAKFRALVEQLPNTVVYLAALDESSTTLYVSPQISQILGYAQEEYKDNPDTWAQCIHKDDYPGVMAELERCRRTGDPFVSEYRMRRKDGKTIWFRDEAHIIKDKQGIPLFLLGVNTDITERKRIEEELKKAKNDLEIRVQKRTADLLAVNWQLETEIAERIRAEDILYKSEERFRALTENTSDWIWEVDQSFVFTYASPKVKDLLGYEPNEVIGKTPFDFMPEHEARRISEISRSILASRKPLISLENINLHKDGRQVIIETSGVPIFDKNGNFSGYRGIDRDITERKRAEEELKENELRLRKLSDNLPNGLVYQIDTGVDGQQRRFSYISAGVDQLHGITVTEALNNVMSIYGQIIEEDRLRIAEEEDFALSNMLPFRTEVRLQLPSGEIRWRLFTSAPRRLPNNHLIWDGIEIDITERKQAENALLEINETLEQLVAERMAVLDGINRIFRAALTSMTEEELGRACLAIVEEVTQSKFSFISEIGPDGSLHDIAISDSGRDICTMYDKKTGHRRPPGSFKRHGLYGRVLIDGKAFYTNEPSSHPDSIDIPEGHPSLRSFMGTPLLHSRRTIGMIALGNREGGYRQEDLDSLESLAPAVVEALLRVRAENALKQSEARLNRAQEVAHLGSWELDLVDNVLIWSDEVYRIFGLKPQEFDATYEAFLESVHPADRAGVDAAYSGSIREGKANYEIEYRIVRRSDGEVRIVHEKCDHFRDSSGKIIRSAGIVHDITERKMVEDELRERERDLETQTKNLEEMNAALNVLLKKRGEDKAELEKKVLFNIKQVIEPFIEKLKWSGLNRRQKALSAILESNLKEITSSFALSLSSMHLNMTPKEIKVANLIKQGRTSKEICQILGSSEKVVAFHRQNIRKKLGLSNKKINLMSYLQQKIQ